MSVINKMLQDLDKRQQGHSLSNVAVHQAQYVGRPSVSRKWLPICLVSLLIGGLSVYAFQARDSSQAVDAGATPLTISQSQSNETSLQPDMPSAENRHTKSSALSAQTEQVTQSQYASTQTKDNTEPMPTSDTVPSAAQVTSAQAVSVEPTSEQAEELAAVDPALDEPKPKLAITHELERAQSKPSEDADKAIQTEVAASQQAESVGAQPETVGQMAVTEVKLSPSQLAQKQLVLASDAQKQGQLVTAIGYYDKALKLDPSLHEARKQLAALHYGQGELAQAAEVLSQGRLLYPQEFEFALLLARVQQAMGDTDSALVSLTHIPDSHSLARQKWLAQTDLAQKQGQFTLVEQAYRQLLLQEPQQAKWWMGLAYALDSQKQFYQASQAYRTALSYSGLSTQATAFIEQRLQQLGDSQ